MDRRLVSSNHGQKIGEQQPRREDWRVTIGRRLESNHGEKIGEQ